MSRWNWARYGRDPSSWLSRGLKSDHDAAGFLWPLILATAAIVATATALYAGADSPQDRAQAFKPGDVAASTFSGTTLQVEGVKPGIDPVTKTVIDPGGISLRIFDMTSLGGPMTGQVMPQPPVVEFKAKDIGQVFGLAFDTRAADATPAPALYAAATSAFGLNIVGPDKDGDGKPDRLKNGAPGATFMEGQFGGLPDASPGSIWRIDRATGAVSLFANLKSGGLANSGPGIGGLAFDPASLTLYAPDLDTGLIHRLSVAQNGADLGQFDHGVTGRPLRKKPAIEDDGERLDITSPAFSPANPATWRLTPIERRISGLAVHDGRLYYAVAEGPEIWSVGLETDGSFKSDVRFETGVESEKPFPVMGIAFDRDGHMILAQRGDNKNDFDYSAFVAPGASQVLRYAAEAPDDPKTPALWTSEPGEYATGEAKDNRASTGGLAIQYAFKADGTADLASCGGTVVVSADSFGPEGKARGLQLFDIGAVRPANVPPKQSAFVDINPQLSDPNLKGYAGGVAAFQDCSGAGGFPPVADGGGGAFPPVTDGGGGAFPPVSGGGGGAFPPVADGGGGAFPPVTDDGGGTTFPPVTDDGGGGGKAALAVTKTAAVGTCSPKGGCAFNIEVRNGTAEAIAGPIVIDEQIDAPQAAMTGEPNAPWTCAKAAPFTCTHPGPVPANGTLGMRVVFAPNTPPETKVLKNCALVQGTEIPANAPAPVADAGAAATSQCATIALDPNAPVQTGPIVVAKKGAGPCTAKGPCAFAISVTNTSDFEIKDFSIDDQIDAPQAVLAGDPKAPWTCTKTAPFSCTHKGPLAPKATVDLELAFIPNTPPDKKELKNCAIPPLMGVGGKIPGGAPQQPKQIAPEKKSDLFDFRRYKSHVEPASFLPQSYPAKNGLLHLAGGAGGNIGGATNKCLSIRAPTAFSLKQADGTAIIFENVVVDAAGNITGSARIDTSRRGTFSGRYNGSLLSFLLVWSDGTRGDYTGRTDAEGNLSGQARDIAGGPNVKFTGLQGWPCARNEICDKYAKAAAETAQKFNKLSCGPDEPPGRWSSDVNSHVNWCMGQPPSSTLLNSETVARTEGLAKCQADRAVFCEGYVAAALVIAKDFESRKCTENHAGFLSTDPAAQQKLCLEESRGNLDSISQSRKILLDTCIAKLANAGGGAGGGAGDGGNGGGTAAEPAPEQCAVVPIELEVASDKDPVGNASKAANGLEVTKTAVPPATCEVNQPCSFNITIKNTTAAAIPGPIELIESVTGAGGDLKIFEDAFGVSPPAPWSCTKGRPSTCTHPGPVVAGGAIDMPIGMTPRSGTTATSMRNCAALVQAAGAPPAQSCAGASVIPAPPAPGDLSISKAPANGVASCVDNTDCRFVIGITNNGKEPLPGPIVINETVSDGDGALFGTAEISTPMPAPWTCAKTGQTFQCSHPGPIAPGTISPSIGVRLGPGTAAKAVKNCVTIQGQSGAPACATVPIGPPPPPPAPPIPPPVQVGPAPKPLPPPPPPVAGNAPNIAVTMRPLTNICAIRSIIGVEELSKGNCQFEATFTNNGNATFEGSLHYDVITNRHVQRALLGACISKVSDLTGASPQTRNCEIQGNAKLVKAGAVSVLIDVEPGDGWVKNNVLKVCTKFSYRSKSSPQDPGTITSDDEACAEILLDPFAVSVKKTGDTACAPGSDCKFQISVFNPGPIDHVAPVTISDKLTGLSSAQIVSINPPLPCATQPTQIPFTCTTPGDYPLLLGPNGEPSPPKLFDMVIRLPNDASAEQFSNCASVSADATGAAAQEACHTVATKPVAATAPPASFRPIVKTAVSSSCDATAPCDFKVTVTNTLGRPMTGPIVVDDLVTIAGEPATQMKLVSGPPAPWTCIASAGPGMQCSHPGPLAINASIDLTLGLQPLPGSIGTATEIKNCATLQGMRPAFATACASIPVKPGATPPVVTPPPVVTAPPASCTAGMILTGGLCACPSAMKFSNGKCVGQGGINKIDPTVDEDSKARREAPQCPDGFVGKPPRCCPRGTEFRDGACRGPRTTTPPPECPEGFHGKPPNCCPRGTQFRDGACRGPQAPAKVEKSRPKVCPPNLPVGKFPNCCPVNARFIGNGCRCLPGFVSRRGQCVQPPKVQTRPEVGCPQGQIMINGQCSRLSIPNPQQPRPQQQGKCPPSAPEGTPPNCRCPAGTVSRDGFCRPANCPPNMTGTPPNCNRICPPGTVNRDQSCVPVQQPKPAPAPAPKPTTPAKKPCPPGWDGDFFPNCAKPPS